MVYPYINIDVKNKKYKLLVDTGSNKTIIFRLKSTLTSGCRKKWVRFKTFLLPCDQVNVKVKSNNVLQITDILVVNWQKYLEYARDIVKNIGIYSYFQKFQYDGILGLDLLKQSAVKINCTNNVSSIITNSQQFIAYNESLVSIGGHIAMKVHINGVRYEGIVDTGINVCDIVLPRKIAGLKKLRTQHIWLWNEKKLIAIYKLKGDVQILNKRFKNLRFAVFHIENINNPIICYPLLQKFKTIIFEKCKKIYTG